MLGCITFSTSPEDAENLTVVQNLFRTPRIGQWIPNQLFSLLFLASSLSLALACLFPLKLLFLEALPRKPTNSCRAHFMVALFLSGFLCACSLAFTRTSLAIQLVGLGFYPLVCFILPALFFLSLPAPRPRIPSLLAWF